MNRLSTERRAQVIASLVEGNSIRATVRMTGAAKNTVTKLLVDIGATCADYQDRALRDLPCTDIQWPPSPVANEPRLGFSPGGALSARQRAAQSGTRAVSAADGTPQRRRRASGRP